MHQEPLIRLLNVTRTYALGRVHVRALSGVSLDVDRGEFLALAGPSGSGKTTLLNLIGCIDKPDSGRILIDGVDVTSVPLHRLAATRRDTLGFIFQTFNLIPVLTAYENVEYPLLLQHVPAAERRTRVLDWLEQVGLADQARQPPDQLSGGQRQRVAIARAMAGQPKLVLADEPTANLDSVTAAKILDLLETLTARPPSPSLSPRPHPAVRSPPRRCVRMHDGAIVDEPLLEARAS